MTIASLDEVASFDDDGNVTGLQFAGRERSIQEWRDAKEDAAYRKLFAKLQSRNWAAKRRGDSEFRARGLAATRRYRERHRSVLSARQSSARRTKYEAAPVVNICEECGKSWSPPYEKRNKQSRFCSKSCRNRNHGRQRAAARNRGMRDMSVESRVFAFLRASPGSEAGQIAAGTGAKRASLLSLLKQWSDAGRLHRSKASGHRWAYSVAGERSA